MTECRCRTCGIKVYHYFSCPKCGGHDPDHGATAEKLKQSLETAAVKLAIACEREDCAKLAESTWTEETAGDAVYEAGPKGKAIAAMIRARTTVEREM